MKVWARMRGRTRMKGWTRTPKMPIPRKRRNCELWATLCTCTNNLWIGWRRIAKVVNREIVTRDGFWVFFGFAACPDKHRSRNDFLIFLFFSFFVNLDQCV